MRETLQIWPQLLVLAMTIGSWIACLVLHGKPQPNPNYDATRLTFGLVVTYFILAEGGFWKPLGW